MYTYWRMSLTISLPCMYRAPSSLWHLGGPLLHRYGTHIHIYASMDRGVGPSTIQFKLSSLAPPPHHRRALIARSGHLPNDSNRSLSQF